MSRRFFCLSAARFARSRLGIRWTIVIYLPCRIRLVANNYTSCIVARSSPYITASVLAYSIASSKVAIPSSVARPLLYLAYLRFRKRGDNRIPHDKEHQNGWRTPKIIDLIFKKTSSLLSFQNKAFDTFHYS